MGPLALRKSVNCNMRLPKTLPSTGSLREAVSELETREDRSPAAAVRLGVCYYLLGRNQLALNTLKTGDGGALAHFYMGKANAGPAAFRRGPAKLRRRRQSRL